MTPEIRHGTTAGYRTHKCRCAPCTAANTRYDQYRRLDVIQGVQRRVPAIGSLRRVQALATMGWSLQDVAHGCGWQSEQAVHRSINRPNVNAETAERIAAFYDANHDKLGPSPGSRTRAIRQGHPSPDRWFDIDNPDERPDPGYTASRGPGDPDPVVVDRILGGDMSLAPTATKAERIEIVARWSGSLNELERLSGWEPRRYKRKDVA